MYTFTVSALNCGTQRGEEANISVNLQGMSVDRRQQTNEETFLHIYIYIYIIILVGSVYTMQNNFF